MVVMRGRSARPTPVPRPRPQKRIEDVLEQVRRGAAVGAVAKGVIDQVKRAARSQPVRPAPAPSSAPSGASSWDGLGFWRLSLGLGMGKFMLVQPPFKPDQAAGDTRAVESSSFAGLGLEIRPLSFWRFFADVAGHSHSTKAATQGKLAYAVDVPGLSTAVFPDSDVYYRMDTSTFRLGTRFSLPFDRVEPWVGGGMAWYSWKAMLTDASRSLDYGSDAGLAWGLEAHAGVDFKFGSRPRWIVTPFYEYGAQLVGPRFADLGGSGKVWKDHAGTWVEAPQRVGLMLGVEW